MFEEVLSKNAKSSLAALGRSGLFNKSYLSGGTALALQIRHRLSYDFDFFTPKEFDNRIFIQRLKKAISAFTLERTAWGTILGNIGKTRFSLFFYNYPLLFTAKKFLDVNVADVKDIAPMKIAAIADRGTRRDFVDLYFITEIEKVITLEKALELYDKKFKVLKQNKIHILKSLRYFEDAEKGPIPNMLKAVKWDNVKKFFMDEVTRISKKQF